MPAAKISDPILLKIVSSIVDIADPDKIILFGSRARGDNDANSDYDVCVLKSGLEKRNALAQQIYREMNAGAPVDVIVNTPQRFEELKDKWFYIYCDINKEGKVLYEK